MALWSSSPLSPRRTARAKAIPVTLPNLLRIKDLLNGSGANDYQSVQVYECDTTDMDGCLNPVAKGVSLVGLKQRVHEILAGSGGGNGLVYKFATNTGPLTQNEMAFMDGL
ncbi:MAG: hypothetical protein DM484_08085 [Candidatus Methylumidiphilus alinenensis]|uniref:Uncharacterized protein n=1 Tax=Candidatus Methylumidiphilus alinenensis TaxID=2202197 RepID=A0A2W4TAD8_9GAMM|nr:MAG: hypothetical protein DM484_08085 [Candidatus Methylumidiphilus alinenensis]